MSSSSFRRAVAVAAAALMLIVPQVAAAGTMRAGGLIDQYMEDIPTAGGPDLPSASGGSPPSTPASLPTAAQQQLVQKAGKDAKTLREVATSPRYGAPNSTVALTESSGASPAAVSAAVGAITDGSDGRTIGLFIALLAITAVSLGFAAARRRKI